MSDWRYYNGNDNLQFNCEWQDSWTNTTVSLAPYLQRWDRYDTWNSGGEFWEHLTLPDGTSGLWGGYGYYRLDGTRANDYTRTIDTFATRTYTRGHSAYNVYLTIDCYNTGTAYGGTFHSLGDSNITWTFTVPARPSYTVTYNANGGTSAPSSQTKWHDEALTLTSNKPSRTGYTFVKWNTRDDGTGTNYESGATYNSNAALTLYAVWQKNTWVVTYKANGGTESDFTATKVYNETLTLASSGFTRTYYSLNKWNTSADGGGTSYALGANYTQNANLTLYAIWLVNVPSAPTSLSASRYNNTDTRIDISWTRPSDASTTWGNVVITRSVDGGDYASLVTLAGTATSYSDTTVTANHSYRYLVRSYNNGGGGQYSSAAYTSTIYNTPAAPSGITAASVPNSTDVILTLTNPAITATGFEVEYSLDGESWSTSGMTITSSSGDPVTQINLSMSSGGLYYFRVRNTRSTLKSAWIQSAQLPTIVPPNPPIINSPTSGSFVQYGGNTTSVTFDWTHQPIDGTAQTAYQIEYSINGGATNTLSGTTSAQTRTVSLSLSVNSSVTWRARTKGAYNGYGEWSATQTFAVYKAPSVSVTSLPSPITTVPVNYELSYTDESGVFSSGRLDIKLNGTTVYSESLNTPQNGTIEGAVFASEFVPADRNTYSFVFTVTSNTNLSASATTSRSVSMSSPHLGTLSIANDPESGYVNLIYGWDDLDGGQPVREAKLLRVSANGTKELASSQTNNASCLDMYAPLNTDYHYVVITTGDNLAVIQHEFANKLNTGWWFVYWDGQIARAKWNPNGSQTVSRPERTRVHYIGRKDPVSYDGTAVLDETNMEWRIVEREYAQQFLKMVRDIGRGVYKSGSGEVYHADFDSATVSSDFHRSQPYGSLALPIVRIDGDAL